MCLKCDSLSATATNLLCKKSSFPWYFHQSFRNRGRCECVRAHRSGQRNWLNAFVGSIVALCLKDHQIFQILDYWIWWRFGRRSGVSVSISMNFASICKRNKCFTLPSISFELVFFFISMNQLKFTSNDFFHIHGDPLLDREIIIYVRWFNVVRLYGSCGRFLAFEFKFISIWFFSLRCMHSDTP